MSIFRRGLKHLADVDWSSLRTAHGTADYVPVALKALACSRDASHLFDAYWALDNYIVLQGTLYESAFFAIPFILDILLSSCWPPQRVAAYDLLIEIARGVVDPGRPWILPSETPENLREACRRVIVSALPAFEPDLSAADANIRRRALDLLTSFDDAAGHLTAVLAGIDPGHDMEFARLLERAKSELCQVEAVKKPEKDGL